MVNTAVSLIGYAEHADTTRGIAIKNLVLAACNNCGVTVLHSGELGIANARTRVGGPICRLEGVVLRQSSPGSLLMSGAGDVRLVDMTAFAFQGIVSY
jgi:hypothetical protein